jgi:hypothetical protein
MVKPSGKPWRDDGEYYDDSMGAAMEEESTVVIRRL